MPDMFDATTYQRAQELVSEMRKAANDHSSYFWSFIMQDGADMLERVLETVYDGRIKEVP